MCEINVGRSASHRSSRSSGVDGSPRSARFTGLGLQIGRPFESRFKEFVVRYKAVSTAFSRTASAMAEPRENCRPRSARSRTADFPIFMSRTRGTLNACATLLSTAISSGDGRPAHYMKSPRRQPGAFPITNCLEDHRRSPRSPRAREASRARTDSPRESRGRSPRSSTSAKRSRRRFGAPRG